MSANMKVLAGLLLFTLASSPLELEAQDEGRDPVSQSHVISGGPLLLLAGWFNAEYERRLSENMTVGVAAGWLDLSDDDYTNVSGFLRYYPQEGAFSRFYGGARAGFHRVNEALVEDQESDSHTALGVGIDFGYAWLLGPGGSFYVGLGVGGTHLFGDIGEAAANIPNLRLIDIGIAF